MKSSLRSNLFKKIYLISTYLQENVNVFTIKLKDKLFSRKLTFKAIARLLITHLISDNLILKGILYYMYTIPK